MNIQEKKFYANLVGMAMEKIAKFLEIITEKKVTTIMTLPLPILQYDEFIYDQDNNVRGIEYINGYNDAGELQIMARDIWFIEDGNKLYIKRDDRFFHCDADKVCQAIFESYNKAKLWSQLF